MYVRTCVCIYVCVKQNDIDDVTEVESRRLLQCNVDGQFRGGRAVTDWTC